MNYTETSLAIVEYKINELVSKKKQIDLRLKELIEIRDNIREEYKLIDNQCNSC